MRQAGRRSSASMVVRPRTVTEVIERIQPPRHMAADQVEVWHGIVSGHPPDWFPAGSIPILIQLCRHVVISDRLAELIEGTEDKDEWSALLRDQRQESEEIRRLATSLRLTPQSLLNHHGNKQQIKATNRPWTTYTAEEAA
jgi:hypothetical protein